MSKRKRMAINRSRVLSLGFILVWSISLYSQEIHRLSSEQVLAILRTFHPVIRQASIEVSVSENEILKNRGAFDPSLSGKIGGKNLKQEDYYQTKEWNVEVPTWYGIDLEAGMANFEGQRLDNATTIGNSSYIGVSIPLLKNLTYDKRRGYLDQAKVMNRMTIEEQRNIINDLILGAMKAYWEWVKAYETYKILDDLVKNNEERVQFVRKSIAFGERPAIDSVEAISQLLQFQIEKEYRWNAFLNAGNELSLFLWKENASPYNLDADVIPVNHWDNQFHSVSPKISLEELIREGIQNHPEIKMYEQQVSYYKIQRKMYFQDLLPKLDLNYRLLNASTIEDMKWNVSRPFSENYQYSLKLDIPLRLSQGRAQYKTSKLKINYAELALLQKMQVVSLKIKTYFNNYLNYENLNRLQYENYTNYKMMVKAEETRFQNGESNLFTINARETKALEALEKLIDLKTKYFKSIYELKWSAGVLK